MQAGLSLSLALAHDISKKGEPGESARTGGKENSDGTLALSGGEC